MAPDKLADVNENYRYNNIFDNRAAQQDLDFRYTVHFSEGVRRTITWLDENQRILNCDFNPLDDAIIAAWDLRQTGFPL
jgi:hypothetical protein